MKNLKTAIFAFSALLMASEVKAQTLDDSGISAGFFDSTVSRDINFSDFHLPPLGILLENAKATPTILLLEKRQEIAEAEVVKQKKHIFSYVTGHASYSYGKTDMWGNNSSTYSTMIYQFQGSVQNYWNVGVNLSVPLEDILDLGHSVKRKRLLVDQAQLEKDQAYDNLKLQIVSLYVSITNNLTALKTAGVSAAIYQGSNQLEEEDFHQGNRDIADYAYSSLHGQSAVNTYQRLLTQITTDILTLELLTHTPILTNTTTEITLDSTVKKSDKQIRKENKEMDKKLRKAAEAEEKRIAAMEKEEKNKKEKKDGDKEGAPVENNKK